MAYNLSRAVALLRALFFYLYAALYASRKVAHVLSGACRGFFGLPLQPQPRPRLLLVKNVLRHPLKRRGFSRKGIWVKVLGKMAEVMNLTASERAYLFRLANKLDPATETGMVQRDNGQAVDLKAMVDAIKVPAYILNEQWEAMAWNRPAKELLIGWLDQPKTRTTSTRPNLMKFMFLEPKSRSLITDWSERANRLVAEFRADCGKHADQEPLAGLIETLMRESGDFKSLWNSHRVLGREGGARRFSHPLRGEITFEQVTLALSTRSGFKLVMLLHGNRQT